MTQSEPDSRGLDAQPANDPLAARLLAARRALNARDIDPDVGARLHLRFRAICTSLKMPTANRGRLAQRLDRLIADAQTARRGTCATSAGSGLAEPVLGEPVLGELVLGDPLPNESVLGEPVLGDRELGDPERAGQ